MSQKISVRLIEKRRALSSDQRFKTKDEALAALMDAAKDKDIFSHFHSVWKELQPESKPNRSQLKRVMFRELAMRLSNGQLRLRRLENMRSVAAETTTQQPHSAPALYQPLPRPRERPMFLRPRPEPKPPPPKIPPVDIGQQVDVLLRAAQSGAPFCEQCRTSSS